MKKKLLAIQFQSVIGDKKVNFAQVSSLIEKFFTKDIDIIVLPEVWTTGWYCPIFKDLAEYSWETEEFLSTVAKKYNVNIIGGSYIKKTKNTCPVFNRRGEITAYYEKIHLYAPDGEAEFITPGETPVIVDIEGLKIGLSICYDIRFPELFRSYINTAAPPELMINVSAWPLSRSAQYAFMASSRAIENQCYFLALSQTGQIKKDTYNAGNSLLVEPMGKTVQNLGTETGVIAASIDTDIVKKTRQTYPNLLNRKIYDFGFKPAIKNTEGACLKKQ